MIDRHTIEVYTPDGVEIDASSAGGRISIDRSWNPHVQGTLTLPASSAALAIAAGDRLIVHLLQRTGLLSFLSDFDTFIAGGTTTPLDDILDAGTSTEVFDELIEAGNYNTPAVPATSRRFDLVVSASPRRRRDTVTIELASDEHIDQDDLWMWPTDLVIDATTGYGMLDQAFTALAAAHDAFDWEPPTIVNLSTPNQYPVDPITITAPGRVFDQIVQRLSYLRHRLYSPGDGTMLLRDYPWVESHTITVSEGHNLIDWELQPGGGEAYLVSFIDPADPAERDYYTETPFPELVRPPRTFVELGVPTPTAPPLVSGTYNPADPYIARQRRTTSPDSVTAISDYSTRPGCPLDVQLPDEDLIEADVDAVTFELGAVPRMTITF